MSETPIGDDESQKDTPLGDRFVEAFERGDRWEAVGLYKELMQLVNHYDDEDAVGKAGIDAQRGQLRRDDTLAYHEKVTEFVESEAAKNPADAIARLGSIGQSMYNDHIGDHWLTNVQERLRREYGIDRETASPLADAVADDPTEAQAEAMAFEAARRQYHKELFISGTDDWPELDELPEPEPEADQGPDIEP
jgi:hypothetical protein